MTFSTGNQTLDKNLECIAKYNPRLAQEIADLPHLNNDIQLIETELKEPNLTFNGLPLHSQDGAEAQAQDIFKRVNNFKLSRHIVFGIGLGHLFKEFCERSKGIVFLIEPSLEILRVTLELVDFSKELSQNNVLIFSNIESFKVAYINTYKYNADSTFSILNSYKELYSESIQGFFKQIEMIMGGCIAQYNTVKKEGVRSITMLLDNLSHTIEAIPLKEISDAYKGKTALIVSAGPSLDKNIEIIKKNRDNVIIFCVGTAFKALASNGIMPDFINMIEINDCSSQLKGYDLSDMNIILEPYTNTSIYNIKTKQKYLFPTNTAHANAYWANLTNTDISIYNAKGTVSLEALHSAKMLGFKKIILVGQDLAYIDNKCYSSSAAYSELAFDVNKETGKPEFKINNKQNYIKSLLPIGEEEVKPLYENFVDYKINNLNETLYFVKGIKGDMLPTQSGYATFIEHFREFAMNNKNLELINASMIGAQIDGFENISLDKALKNSIKVAAINPSTSFKYNKGEIVKNIKNEYITLEKILAELKKSTEIIFKYDKEYNKNQSISPEANNHFKTLLKLYDKLTNEYYNSNPVFQMLAFNYDIEVQYIIQTTENVSIETIKALFEKLRLYFTYVVKNVESTMGKMKEQEIKINESINSESK